MLKFDHAKWLGLCLLSALTLHHARAVEPETKATLKALFIGNSYTARHKLPELVKSMAEAGTPGLTFEPSSVIYGGRTLADHWRLGSQNFVRVQSVTAAEIEASIAALEKDIAADPNDTHARNGVQRQRQLLAELESRRTKWDVVILQSYRDDLEGANSSYAQYAARFAELAREQGARVILYETTPTTQNAEPIVETPDPAPIQEKERAIAQLANRIGASVAPMALVALRCQTERPDLTLRFVNDGHLNQTLAYLSACTIYAALFERSPVGLPVHSVTDIRFFEQEPTNREKDRDGNPITRLFSERDRLDLQRIAWESYQQFQAMRKE